MKCSLFLVSWLGVSCVSLQQELAMELDEKREVIKSVQEEAERLIKNHPARPTIEVCPSVCAEHDRRHWMWLHQLYTR